MDYFAGGRVEQIQREGYQEPVTIPAAGRNTIVSAIRAAVKTGRLWPTSGAASILSEDVPAGLLTDNSVLQASPKPISPLVVMPVELPEAWTTESATAATILDALSLKAGKTLPWMTVQEAIDGAVKTWLLELTPDSGPWLCAFSGAQCLKLRLAKMSPPIPPHPLRPLPGCLLCRLS